MAGGRHYSARVQEMRKNYPQQLPGGKRGRGGEEGEDKGGLKVGNIELLKEEMKVKRVYGMKDLGELN